MKLLFILGIIVVACGPTVYSHGSSDESGSGSSSGSSESGESSGSCGKSDKVKLTSVKLLKVNKEYVESYKAEVVEVNKNSNHLTCDFDVKKNFPSDTEFVVEISKSSSKSGTYKPVKSCSVPVKDSSHKYYKYLPDELLELNKKGQCITKGHYKYDDADYFKFYELLSEETLKDSYFKVVTSYKCTGQVVLTYELSFEPCKCSKKH